MSATGSDRNVVVGLVRKHPLTLLPDDHPVVTGLKTHCGATRSKTTVCG